MTTDHYVAAGALNQVAITVKARNEAWKKDGGYMNQQVAEELVDYCRESVGHRLRTVTRYSLDTFDSRYLREGMLDDLGFEDEESWEMFRLPVFQMHRRLWELPHFANTLAAPDVGRYTFGDVTVIQLLLSKEEGIWISFDNDGDPPDEFVAGLKAIVSA